MSGYLAAAVAALIWASYPVATRAGITGSFTAEQLLALRFGIGALLFLPYLLWTWRSISGNAWRLGIPLTIFQGAGMATLVICGLQFAPASHASALGPGMSPAWVVLLGFLLFSRQPAPRMAMGTAFCLAGVMLLALQGASGRDASVLIGDTMFLAASALGALYVLQLRSWGLGALQSAAIVSLYSALLVVPWYFWSAPEALPRASAGELAWQVLWQGVLNGCVALFALSHAVRRLGAERSSALVALVPVVTALLGLLFLGEIPSATETAACAAISAGVWLGASGGYAGSPASTSAAMKGPA